MVHIGVVSRPNSEDDNTEPRQKQLERIKPKVSELMALFSGETPPDNTENSSSDSEVTTFTDEAGNITELFNEKPADTYVTGTFLL